MPGYTKSEAPVQFVEELKRLEDQSDRCYEQLRILGYPKNLAHWALLIICIEALERTIDKHGAPDTPQFRAATINLGRVGSILIDWIEKHGNANLVARSKFRWNRQLAVDAGTALDVGHNYFVFMSCFPAWHRDRLIAEIVGPQVVRFTTLGDANDRRVSAFQKGFRPRTGQGQPSEAPNPWVPVTLDLKERLGEVFQTCRRDGPLGFKYPEPRDLFQFLAASYRRALDSLFRRDESLHLAQYSLGQFKSFYSSLLAICAVHEHFCFKWVEQGNRYPLSSAVLVKQRSEWTDVLAETASLSVQTVNAILSDLTTPTARPIDLLVHPFVPLDANSRLLGLIPHFVLHSNSEENIIRVCSYTQPDEFSVIALSKENEMREDLISACNPKLLPSGPISLPDPIPNIDLVLEEPTASTALIAELKWSRKPLRPLERIDRDAEIWHGLDQLRQIENFLKQNPTYLMQRGALSASLSDFLKIHYVLIARDHLVWVDPEQEHPIIEYDTFKRMLRTAPNLQEGMTEILKFNWLPVEGRDFQVRYERFHANEVSIEAEIYYPFP